MVEEVTIVPSGKTKKRETNNTWHQCASYIVTYRKQQNQNKERSGDQKNRKSALKQNNQKETESALMLPKRKKQRSLDKKLKSVIKSQNKLLQRAVHPPPNSNQKPNSPTPMKKNRKYDTVVFNINSESIDL